jgi:type IX secretion system PorP/SprF family membrane protein
MDRNICVNCCLEFYFVGILKLIEMKKLLLSVSFALVLVGAARAQDVHFTQYFTSPLTLNPAMAGLMNEDFRFAANYRAQWTTVSPNPYTTGTVSYDMAILKGKLPEGDALGVGLLAVYDKAGSGGLTTTNVGANLAYHKAFGRDKQHHISLGMQGAMIQQSIDYSKLNFEDGYNPLTNTFGPAPTEAYWATKQNISYMDISGGLMYSGKLTDRTMGYFGYSIYNLNQPVESFTGFIRGPESNTVAMRQSLYLGGNYTLNDKTTLFTSGLLQFQASATEAIIGAAVGWVMNPGHDGETTKNTLFYLGGWYRYGDALCPYVGFEWSKMRFGVSYDVNVSNFSPATSFAGAYEFSIQFFGNFVKGEKMQTYNWSCPKIF